MRRVHALVVSFFLTVVGVGCVAPVIRGPARPPARHTFVGTHGIPNAYGDGVCALAARHTHSYPPVPKAAFDLDGGAHRDRRQTHAYFDPHPHVMRSCFRSGWHLHLEPPLPTLMYRSDVSAFAEDGDRPVLVFDGPHASCAALGKHGHAPK